MTSGSKRTRRCSIIDITDPSVDIVIYDDSPSTPRKGSAKRKKPAPQPIIFRVDGPLPLEAASQADPTSSASGSAQPSTLEESRQDAPEQVQGVEFMEPTQEAPVDEGTDDMHSGKKVNRIEPFAGIANTHLLER